MSEPQTLQFNLPEGARIVRLVAEVIDGKIVTRAVHASDCACFVCLAKITCQAVKP